MEQMFLPEIERHEGDSAWSAAIRQLREAQLPIPQIWHLFAYKPDRTDHLAAFTQGVMRGPSPLPPGIRELIAAFTSRRNDCPF
ncbi:MAG TPA: peroxidase [Vicinamibacterales bacterium]|nr:peroxidase [Vicinamibacterales bacterium]